eukprot:CAMPEP_0197013738 /NCGR_PEP_ID=MMETSP1380-20130617/67460_1 /TAXON_ID=5936 /ORGANISM="Euplotes crassus, Strain CT5" /LENGTH=69 /DNA_ID=CAMNT_0042438197 /DNA_START=1535 /DNA_END=1744 /DNA_ORIENTATION=-
MKKNTLSKHKSEASKDPTNLYFKNQEDEDAKDAESKESDEEEEREDLVTKLENSRKRATKKKRYMGAKS